MLEPLGLNATTEGVYRVLLRNPAWGVADIAVSLGISEDEVRLELDHLADLSLVKNSHTDPAQLLPVSPEVGLSLLLARREAELARHQQQIEQTREAITTISAEYQATRAQAGTFERLESLQAVRDRLEELAHDARSACLSLLPGGPVATDTMQASRPLDELALRRGVLVRTVFQDSFRNDPATVRYAAWLAELGGQCRTTPLLPMLMVIIDHRTALVPLDPDNARAGALQTQSPGIITALTALFDQIWESARPFAQQESDTAQPISTQERALLKLLAAGATDQAAANKLGLSLRTVRRMMADMQQRLNARSRFQAGVHANQQGWL